MSAPTEPAWYWLRGEGDRYVPVQVVPDGGALAVVAGVFRIPLMMVAADHWGPRIEPPAEGGEGGQDA